LAALLSRFACPFPDLGCTFHDFFKPIPDTCTQAPQLAGHGHKEQHMDNEKVRRPRTGLMVAIVGATLVLAATIGVSAAMAADPAGTAAGAGGPIPVDPAFEKFAACMKDHGVDMGVPVVVSSDSGTGSVSAATGLSVTLGASGPAPSDGATYKAANDACTPILDAAGIKSGAATITSGSGTVESGSLQSGSLEVGIGNGAGVIGVATAGGDVTKMAADFKAYAACMRENGVDMPDPVVDTKAGTAQLQLAGDPSSSAFQAASKACGANLPFAPLPVPAQP
jgi:hypothetical protein